jgi:aldose 1-epimerase
MVRADYQLTDAALEIELSATNVGSTAAPLGLSLHPYLTAPGDAVDDWTFRLPAETVLEVDSERLLPRGRRAVAGTPFDFRAGRRIADTEIDHAFTDVAFAPDGAASATLVDDDGRGVRMSWDRRSPWVQVHTTDVPGGRVHRRCLAVEPMTCPPDAFNSGIDVLRLAPRESAAASCSLSAVGD